MVYHPHTAQEIREMLDFIGARTLDDLFSSIPEESRLNRPLNLPKAMPEQQLVHHMQTLADQNSAGSGWVSFLGAGAYPHFIPSAVTELANRSEFLTPYTPYQPEISQGTLQVAFEYQSMMCRLFALDIANASLYDASTAIAEAALMALRVATDRNTILVCETVHPEYREVLATTLRPRGIRIVTLPRERDALNRAALLDELHADVAALIVQCPNAFGGVEDFSKVSEQVHAAGALMIAAVPEMLSLGLLTPPGDWGADIAVGEGLGLGIPVEFGGPGLGIFATRQQYLRNLPGRVCGETVDANGRRGYVLTLSTREQHIRREKATSNICSNQQNCATRATIYLSMLGKQGLQELAQINAARARYARQQLTAIPGVTAVNTLPYFNEFVIELPIAATTVVEALHTKKIHAGLALSRWYPNTERHLLVCVTELHETEHIDHFARALYGVLKQ